MSTKALKNTGQKKQWRIARKLVGPGAILFVWYLVTSRALVDPLFIPGPSEIASSVESLAKHLPAAVGSTLFITLSGFAIGVLFGAGSALVLAYSNIMRDLFGFISEITRPIPIFALIPLFILWFGLGRTPQIVLIALGTSVVLGVTTLEAVVNVKEIYTRAAAMLGAGRFRIYRTVIIPAILPHLIGAVRVAAAGSWGLSVAAEFMGSQQGLGYLIINRQAYLDTAGIVVLVIIYSVLAWLVDKTIAHISRRLVPWNA